MLFILLVIAPFNVLWLHVFDPSEDPTMRLFSLMVLIPDFFIFILLRALAGLVWDRVRFGRPRLRFEAFPFFVGADVRAHLSARAFQGQPDVSATLRCIDERMVATASADGGTADSVEGLHAVRVATDVRGPFPQGRRSPGLPAAPRRSRDPAGARPAALLGAGGGQRSRHRHLPGSRLRLAGEEEGE
jgi:hypothetical protein